MVIRHISWGIGGSTGPSNLVMVRYIWGRRLLYNNLVVGMCGMGGFGIMKGVMMNEIRGYVIAEGIKASIRVPIVLNVLRSCKRNLLGCIINLKELSLIKVSRDKRLKRNVVPITLEATASRLLSVDIWAIINLIHSGGSPVLEIIWGITNTFVAFILGVEGHHRYRGMRVLANNRNGIVKPGNNNDVSTRPCREGGVSCDRLREGSVNERQSVLHRKCHLHRSAPGGIVLVIKRLGGENKARSIRMVQEQGVSRILTWIFRLIRHGWGRRESEAEMR
ncbi:cyclic pyranopterin phosphate synthase MoaA [Sesbania bispinosa]|nr:cyclic pyranopterin phosphate synthase MoaA [Sesbania bispinosa]